mmetsp:Transcript_22487/g.66264  ORF Transcript_22487/g.66264 Transcript_22487/m.66264 type:complete len:260 (+) Transcript_22487:686-1465(+)
MPPLERRRPAAFCASSFLRCMRVSWFWMPPMVARSSTWGSWAPGARPSRAAASASAAARLARWSSAMRLARSASALLISEFIFSSPFSSFLRLCQACWMRSADCSSCVARALHSASRSRICAARGAMSRSSARTSSRSLSAASRRACASASMRRASSSASSTLASSAPAPELSWSSASLCARICLRSLPSLATSSFSMRSKVCLACTAPWLWRRHSSNSSFLPSSSASSMRICSLASAQSRDRAPVVPGLSCAWMLPRV